MFCIIFFYLYWCNSGLHALLFRYGASVGLVSWGGWETSKPSCRRWRLHRRARKQNQHDVFTARSQSKHRSGHLPNAVFYHSITLYARLSHTRLRLHAFFLTDHLSPGYTCRSVRCLIGGAYKRSLLLQLLSFRGIIAAWHVAVRGVMSEGKPIKIC